MGTCGRPDEPNQGKVHGDDKRRRLRGPLDCRCHGEDAWKGWTDCRESRANGWNPIQWVHGTPLSTMRCDLMNHNAASLSD
eukprot:scaffold932_cov328-Pavlova_lutheri.AAC.42